MQEIIAAPDNVIVWGAGGVNERSLHICFVPGFAAWNRSQWLVHISAIQRGARRAAAWGGLYGIPMVHLTPAQVAAGNKGICTHGDVTAAGYTASMGHTDPGPSFPMDVFLAAANPAAPAPTWRIPLVFLCHPQQGTWIVMNGPGGQVNFLAPTGAIVPSGMDQVASDRTAFGTRSISKLVPRTRNDGKPGFQIIADDGAKYVPQSQV